VSDAAPQRPLTVTVGGLAGTGTSTLCRLLAAHLDLPYTYAGALFRQEAARRSMTLAEFGQLCQDDPAVDRSLDDRQLELLQAGGVLLEGRMAGWLAAHHDVDAFTVWVVCDEDERMRRIAGRDGGAVAEQRERTLAREASEHARFASYHGADLTDLSIYDLVLDSTTREPSTLVEAVLDGMRAAGVAIRTAC